MMHKVIFIMHVLKVYLLKRNSTPWIYCHGNKMKKMIMKETWKKNTCNKIRSKAKVTCWRHGWRSGWLNYDSCSLLLATDNADGSNNDAQKYETKDSSHHCPNDCSNGSVGEIRVNKLSFLNLKWRIQFIFLLHFLIFACL